MTVFLITYDLNKEVNRPNMAKRIREGYPNWARLSESSYAVETSNSEQEVFDYLRPLVDDNDAIYIITLKRPYTGWGPNDVNEWLGNKLTF